MSTLFPIPDGAAPQARRMRRWPAASLLALTLAVALAPSAWAIRVKDVAYLRGARENQLIGYGLVVGLDGTGDSAESLLARKPLRNALERMAISINSTDVKGRSIAGVLVTATLPPFSKAGSRLDVTVDALGDTTSLRGGTLMYTLLHGSNQLIYATAQGPLTGIPKGIERQQATGADVLGGPQPAAAAAQQSKPLLDPRSSLVATKGYVLGGALVEREIALNLNTRSRVFINLKQSDFTTAFRLSKLINRELGDGSARAKDAGTVEVSVPDTYLGQTVELISRIENLEIIPDATARVVLDERTGTIVMGQHVRISPIAIAHGNLNIEIGAPAETPPGPAPAAPAAIPAAAAGGEQGARVALERAATPAILLFKGEVDLKEVVDGLNKIGASSSDLVQVLKIIKSSGALHADLEIR
ncbi:MAG: flagellar basal body P-ring protein FlgI [Candidatus Lambdaproteobacteria bacterium]|nr:flagellar basal body P-ring protein FlgI [Candidatus Lambdaproteobacteria bacterium]